jgi:DMSO/TMAO reductase YedYZ molybdopterin-dependent catalytic subunit
MDDREPRIPDRAEETAETSPDAAKPAEPAPPAEKPAPRKRSLADRLRERPLEVLRPGPGEIGRRSRRDFLLFGTGAVLAAAGMWWLLPRDTKEQFISEELAEKLNSLEVRMGKEKILGRALTFDDDVAEALYSPGRRVRTYRKSDVTPLRNNYNGQTPSPDYVPGWRLAVDGLASGRSESLSIEDLKARFGFHEQVTRLCCVEGWSAVAWWGGIRFADFLQAYPPIPGARFAKLESAVNLDFRGDPDPYYVSLDLESARHPQTLLATHFGGRPLPVAHGAPLRLLAPMKLGLKNIKAITRIAYSRSEPPDYWNERGYSKYDGL